MSRPDVRAMHFLAALLAIVAWGLLAAPAWANLPTDPAPSIRAADGTVTTGTCAVAQTTTATTAPSSTMDCAADAATDTTTTTGDATGQTTDPTPTTSADAGTGDTADRIAPAPAGITRRIAPSDPVADATGSALDDTAGTGSAGGDATKTPPPESESTAPTAPTSETGTPRDETPTSSAPPILTADADLPPDVSTAASETSTSLTWSSWPPSALTGESAPLDETAPGDQTSPGMPPIKYGRAVTDERSPGAAGRHGPTFGMGVQPAVSGAWDLTPSAVSAAPGAQKRSAQGGGGAAAPDPAPATPAPPPAGSATASASGSTAMTLYAVLVAFSLVALSRFGRIQVTPVRWRSVAFITLLERPG
jgi:hypothetical protein